LDPARTALVALGFVHDGEARPGLPARDVWRGEDRQVDLHPVVLDAAGNGWQELDDGAWGLYPADGLGGLALPL